MAGNGRRREPELANYEWQLDTACRGMDSDVFFHPSDEGRRPRKARTAAAKLICRQCPVLVRCRDHALEAVEQYGIWGGLSEAERAAILGLESLRYPAPAGSGRRRVRNPTPR